MSDLPCVTPEPVLPGEAGTRLTAAIGRVLVRELPLARRAAYRLRARPTITFVVLLLASIGFFSNLLTREILLRRSDPEYRLHQRFTRASERQPDVPFTQRWLREYQRRLIYPLVLIPLVGFAGPLHGATHPADQWIMLLAFPFTPRTPEIPPWRVTALVLLLGIPSFAISTLFLVGLLGWVRDGDKPIGLSAWPRYWRDHYLPVLGISFLLLLWGGLWMSFTNVTHLLDWTVGPDVNHVMLYLPVWILILAPFVIIARHVGLKAGAVESIRLLRERWVGLLALFVAYRVGYEVLFIWRAAAPWPLEWWAVNLSIASPAMWWRWAYHAGFALLGLWLAYAFMEIAKSPRRPGATEG